MRLKKRILVCFTISLLIVCSAIYSKATTGQPIKEAFRTYSITLHAFNRWFPAELARIDQAREQERMEREKKLELQAFISSVTSDANAEIEQYQLEYLTRLADQKNVSIEQLFIAFEERKKKEINLEIEQDVTAYLTELIGE